MKDGEMAGMMALVIDMFLLNTVMGSYFLSQTTVVATLNIHTLKTVCL